MSKWQTIETAPLDGTPVDLWAVRGMCGDLGYRSGERYTDCRFARPSFGTEPYGEPRWLGLNDRHIKVTPTHWMPVPECPAPSFEEMQAKDEEINRLMAALYEIATDEEYRCLTAEEAQNVAIKALREVKHA